MLALHCFHASKDRYIKAYLSLRHVLLITQERGFLVRVRIPQGKEPSRHAVDLAVLLKPGNDHIQNLPMNDKHFGDMYTKIILNNL